MSADRLGERRDKPPMDRSWLDSSAVTGIQEFASWRKVSRILRWSRICWLLMMRLLLARWRICFPQEKLDLVEQGGEQLFLLQAGVDVLTPINRAVAGHDDHGNVGLFGADLACQFQPVHAFHAEVGDQNVEVFLLE